MEYVYLDYAASAPECDASVEAGRAYDAASFAGANPNSLHTPGRQAARALDGARATIAGCLGARFRPADVTFTSGGTESNNLALVGMAEGRRGRDARRTRVVVSAVEHDSVLDVAPQLRKRGFDVATCPVDRRGVVDLVALGALVDESCALVSVMSANNETGVVQPVADVASLAHAAGALMHTDAVQAFGRMPLALAAVDAVSLAAHKIGGPVGVGALVRRGRTVLQPLSWGGGQEHGLRAGTQDVRGACCFAAAAKGVCDARATAARTLAGRSARLVDAVCNGLPAIRATVPPEVERLPGIVHFLVDGMDSESLVLKLDEAGFATSAGSACSASTAKTSHVLSAMGVDGRLASLRVSFDERVDETDLIRFAATLRGIVGAMGTGR